MSTISLGLLWYLAFLFSTTVHEAAHAWSALRLGDPTAYRGGQVTLDPMPHIRREPIGTVVFPIVTFLLGGWMMGWASAPYDPIWAERYPRRAAWMALAGPAANLLVAIVAGLGIRLGLRLGVFACPSVANLTAVTVAASAGWWGSAAILASILFTLNVILFSFNLIPVLPLDGSAAATLLMSEKVAQRYRAIMLNPVLSMCGLILAWRAYDPVFRPLFRLALRLLYPGHF
jgi:Zn-dependent protease